MPSKLADAPKYFRAPVVRGDADLAERIDRIGGNYGAGIIRGVSIITEGEALGHGMWIDAEFNAQVADAINAPNKGVKSRWTHPSLSGDGLGRHLGRVTNAKVVGDRVLADLHLAESAHDTPDGDLANYVLNLAVEDPEAFGVSIAFMADNDATDLATIDNPLGFPHARLAELRAADVVDEPAANPDGLFHSRGADIGFEIDDAISYALGLSDTKPAGRFFDVNADRVRGAVSRFLSSHKYRVEPMAEDATPETPEVAPVAELAAEPEQPETDLTVADPRAEAKRFNDAFGAKGLQWYAEGVSFEDAQAKFNRELLAENEELRTKLAAATAAAGEADPVDFQAAEAAPKRRGFAGKIKFTGQTK